MRSLLGLAILTISSTAYADPPQCMRWENQLTVCEALGNGSSTNCTYSAQGIETEQVNAQLFASNAEKACKQLITKMNPAAYQYNPSKKIKACTWSTTDPNDETCYGIWQTPFDPPDEGQVAWCVYDVTGGANGGPDGDIDWDDATMLGYTVSYQTQQPDPHCFCTATGPYDGLAWAHEEESKWAIAIAWLRHTFPKGLKTAVLAKNKMTNNNAYVSDARRPNDTIFDPEPNLQKDNLYDADAAEIDHIIPRVDSKGCLCGQVTPNNAAVISRQLNASMSNTSPLYNADRARMFEKYVTCPSAATARFQGRNYEPRGIESVSYTHLTLPTSDLV